MPYVDAYKQVKREISPGQFYCSACYSTCRDFSGTISPPEMRAGDFALVLSNVCHALAFDKTEGGPCNISYVTMLHRGRICMVSLGHLMHSMKLINLLERSDEK